MVDVILVPRVADGEAKFEAGELEPVDPEVDVVVDFMLSDDGLSALPNNPNNMAI